MFSAFSKVLQYKCTEAGFLLTCTTGLNKVCDTILNENDECRSILFGSKKSEKEVLLFFQFKGTNQSDIIDVAEI